MKAADAEKLFGLRRGRHSIRDYYAGVQDGVLLDKKLGYRLPVSVKSGDMLLVVSLKPKKRRRKS